MMVTDAEQVDAAAQAVRQNLEPHKQEVWSAGEAVETPLEVDFGVAAEVVFQLAEAAVESAGEVVLEAVCAVIGGICDGL